MLKRNNHMIPIFQSPEYLIGKTLWRVLVEQDNAGTVYCGGVLHESELRTTEYEYFDPYYHHWYSMTEHPRYNPDDGSWAGLPKTLLKLYRKYEQEIKA